LYTNQIKSFILTVKISTRLGRHSGMRHLPHRASASEWLDGPGAKQSQTRGLRDRLDNAAVPKRNALGGSQARVYTSADAAPTSEPMAQGCADPQESSGEAHR